MSSPSVELVSTGIPRQALLEFLYKQSKADGTNGSLVGTGLVGGSLVGGSLVGGSLVGGARPSTLELYQKFVKQQLMKGRTKEMADHMWAELTKLPQRVNIEMVTDNAGRVQDPTQVRTMGTLEPLADEVRQRASRDLMMQLWLKANKNLYPGYNYGRDDMLRGPPPVSLAGVDLQGGDFFGDLLNGLSYLSPIGAAMQIASKIAGGKAPKKKTPAAKKKPAAKKPATKKGKSKKDLSGDGFLDDIGMIGSMLTPWGAASALAGVITGAQQ
jgi:hypothetical protein